MTTNTDSPQRPSNYQLTNTLIRLALVALIAFLSFQIVVPFGGLLLWALILSVALYPVHQGLANRMGQRQGRSATVIVLVGLLLIGLPTGFVATSFLEEVFEIKDLITSGNASIPAPDPAVADWPLVGKKTYAVWQLAATDFPAFVEQYTPWIKETTRSALKMLQSGAGGIFLFLVSFIVAGIMMAYGESGNAAMGRIYNRLAGREKGPRLLRLTVARRESPFRRFRRRRLLSGE